MKKFLRIVGLIFCVIVVVLGPVWIIQGNNFFLYKVFAPRQEQVRREVFEQSKAYRQGMIQELENMQFEYLKTEDQDARRAMASVILHRVSDFPESELPYQLRSFINDLRSQK